MAGYSSTPLVKKLGIKENATVFVSDAPANYFDWLSPLPPGIKICRKLSGSIMFIHVFVTTRKDFEKTFLKAEKCLDRNGMLWVSWPKKAAKIQTDLDENIIREFGLQHGLVDVKVCAVDEVWSGLKFVVPLKDR